MAMKVDSIRFERVGGGIRVAISGRRGKGRQTGRRNNRYRVESLNGAAQNDRVGRTIVNGGRVRVTEGDAIDIGRT